MFSGKVAKQITLATQATSFAQQHLQNMFGVRPIF